MTRKEGVLAVERKEGGVVVVGLPALRIEWQRARQPGRRGGSVLVARLRSGGAAALDVAEGNAAFAQVVG